MDNVLESLIIELKADFDGLRRDFARVTTLSRQAGEEAGRAFGQNADRNGMNAGEQLAEGFRRGADGKLRDSRGRFVKSGEDVGEAIGEGMREGLDRGTRGLNTQLVNLASGLSVIRDVMEAVRGAVMAGGSFLKLAGDAEQAQVAFEGLLKDGQKAKDFLADLSTFARNTPFEMEGLKATSRQFLAFGFDAKAVIPILTAVGDAVGMLGGGEDELQRVTLALGQMQAKGKVTAEEMGQLAEIGLPVWQILAKEIGVSVPKAMQMASDGAISSSKGIAALLTGLEERFGGGMEKQSKTLLGMWSNTTDTLKQTATGLSTFLAEKLGAKETLGNLNEGLSKLQTMLSSGQLNTAWKRMGDTLASLNPITAEVRAQLERQFGAMQNLVQNVLLPVFERIKPVVQAVWAEVPRIIEGASRLIQGAFELIEALWVNVLKPVWDAIAPTVQAAVTLIARMLGGLWDVVGSTFSAISKLINGDWKGAWDTMAKMADRVGESVGTAMQKVWEALSDLTLKALDKAKLFGANLKDGIIVGLSGLAEEVARKLDEAINGMTANMPQWLKDVLGVDKAAALRQSVIGGLDAQGQGAQARIDAGQMAGRLNENERFRAFFDAIFSQESRSAGGYNAFNTNWANKGQGAVGKYQIMPFNLISPDQYTLPQSQRGAWALNHMDDRGKPGFGWDYQALGKDYTIREILNSPQLQEAIGRSMLARNLIEEMKKSGNDLETAVKEAAKNWYGRGSTNGPTTQQYANSVWNYFMEEAGLKPGSGKITPAAKTNPTAGQPTGPVDYAALLGGNKPAADDLAKYSLTLADWNKNQARALELAREAIKAEDDLTGKRGLQVKAAMEKWAGEDKARQQSYQLALQLTNKQEAADKDAERREKEAQQRAARINEALRQGKIEAARTELTRLQEMRTNDLRNAGENAQKVAAVEQRYAALTYNAKAAIALKERQDRDADIRNNPDLNATGRAQALKNSETTYLTALKAAGNERNAAQDKINKDAEALAVKNAGTMIGLQTKYVEDYTAQGIKDAEQAGTGVALVNALFKGAKEELEAQWQALNTIQREGNERLSSDALSAANDLAGDGNYTEALSLLEDALSGVFDAAQAGEDVGDSVNVLTDAINRLNKAREKALEVSAQEQAARDAENIRNYYIEQAAQTADQTANAADAGARQIGQADAGRVGMWSRSPGLMLSFLGGAGNEFFGDKFSQLGEEGRAAFLEKLNAVSPDDFAAVPLALLKSMRAKIGDAQEWQGLKGTLDTAIGKSLDMGTNAGGWKELGDIIEGVGKLNRYSDDYGKTLTDRTIPALQALAARITDPELKAAIENTIGALKDDMADVATAMEAGQRAADDFFNALPADQDGKRLEDWNTQLTNLTEGYAAGAISAADFTAQAMDALPKLEALARAAEAQGKTDLAGYYRDAAEGLKGLLSPLDVAVIGFQKLSNALSGLFKSLGMNGMSQVVDGIGQIGDAALKLPGAFKDAQSAWSTFKSGFSLSSLGGLMGAVGGVVNIVGAAINGIMAIGNAIEDMSSSLQAWKKGLREVAEEQKKVLGMSSGGFKSPWADALAKDAANRDQLANSRWYQRLWWGLTGGGPQAISDEAAKLLTELQGIFAQLGDGIASAFTDAMLDAFNSGDMGNFAENFSESFDQVVGKVVLKTMIDAAITQGAVAGDLAELTKAIQEQRYGDIPAIMTKIKADAGVVAGQLGAVLPSIPGFGAGADGSSGSDGADNRALFGNAPTAQLGIPRFEVSLPDGVMKPLGDFAAVIPAFSRATDRLYEAADMIVRSGWGLQPPTGAGTLR